MPQFSYIATSKDGKTLHGTLETTDRESVIRSLVKQDLKPISVKEVSKVSRGNLTLFESNSVKSDDIVMFTRQLSAMISAGVPLTRSITSLADHTESPALKKILNATIKDIEGGMALGDALEKHPQAFNDVYVNMVRAGEAAGILDDILKRLSIQQEKSASIRKKVKSAMTYPMVLIGITVLAFFGLMFFVIPKIGETLQDLGGPDAKLPPLTLAMLAISAFIKNFWFIVLPAMVGGVFGALKYIKTKKGKHNFHKLLLKLPGIKTITVKLAVARFSRTFSALIGAGVPVLEALGVTARAVGNVIYEDALRDAAEQVTNGKLLSEVVEANDLFPSILSQMMLVGEETGKTDEVLIKIADFYEEEVDAAIDGISSIIEPAMIVVMGGMVGLIAASVMGPIAGLAQNIQG